MFTLTKKIILASLVIQALMAPIMVGTVESFAHPSIQTTQHLNETIMVSSHVDWNVDLKMEPLVVPSSASPLFASFQEAMVTIRGTVKYFHGEISPKLKKCLNHKTLEFMLGAFQSTAKHFTVSHNKWNLFCEKIQTLLIHEFYALFTSASAFWMQSGIATVVVPAILGGFFPCIAFFALIGCKIFHQATRRTVPIMDNPFKIFDIDLSDFDYDYEVTNVMETFDPSSIGLLVPVNDGINIISPPMAIDAAFVGPAFVEMRHPPADFDEDELSVASVVHDVDIEATLPCATIYVDYNEYENDDSSIGFGDDAIYDEIFPEPIAMVPTAVLDSIFDFLDEKEPEPIKMFQDFCEYREPQNDFDEEDEDDQSTVDPADDFDSQMEDLLFSFSKLSFKDSTIKTVSDSEMDELADSFANL